MRKPLVEYFNDSWNTVANLTDWKYVGKVTLTIVPILLFTAWYWVIKGLWVGTEYINRKGDAFLEEFYK